MKRSRHWMPLHHNAITATFCCMMHVHMFRQSPGWKNSRSIHRYLLGIFPSIVIRSRIAMLVLLAFVACSADMPSTPDASTPLVSDASATLPSSLTPRIIHLDAGDSACGRPIRFIGRNLGHDRNSVFVTLGVANLRVLSVGDTMIVAQLPSTALAGPLAVVSRGRTIIVSEFFQIQCTPRQARTVHATCSGLNIRYSHIETIDPTGPPLVSYTSTRAFGVGVHAGICDTAIAAQPRRTYCSHLVEQFYYHSDYYLSAVIDEEAELLRTVHIRYIKNSTSISKPWTSAMIILDSIPYRRTDSGTFVGEIQGDDFARHLVVIDYTSGETRYIDAKRNYYIIEEFIGFVEPTPTGVLQIEFVM